MKSIPLLLALFAGYAFGQATVDNSTAEQTIPWKVRAVEPGTCTPPEVYYSTSLSKLRICTAANTWSDLGTKIGTGAGGVWGGITGTLSDQTDLENALSGKQDASAKGAPSGYVGIDANGNVAIAPMLIGKYTVGAPSMGQTALPAASSYPSYLATVVDCESTSACSVGGGTTVALLRSNGTAWSLYGGAGGTSVILFNALLGAGSAYVGEVSNWKWTATGAYTFASCYIDAMTYPTGANLTVDVLKNPTVTVSNGAYVVSGGASIFGTNAILTLTAGGTASATATPQGAGATVAAGDFLLATVKTIGSTVAGASINVRCQ